MFLSQICVATSLESFDQNILHFCVVYSLPARRFVNGFNMGPLSMFYWMVFWTDFFVIECLCKKDQGPFCGFRETGGNTKD